MTKNDHRQYPKLFPASPHPFSFAKSLCNALNSNNYSHLPSPLLRKRAQPTKKSTNATVGSKVLQGEDVAPALHHFVQTTTKKRSNIDDLIREISDLDRQQAQ
jgi:hypothetical protein